MKVSIGPYKNWIGPYQLADMVFFWVDHKGLFRDDDPRHERWDYKACERLGDWLADTWIAKLLVWINSKRPRKIKIRIDNYDTWSMDHTLSMIIHPMLLQLKETKHGSPFVEDEDVPEHLRSTATSELTQEEKDRGATDTLFHNRWNWVLDEMIFAHYCQFNDWEDEYFDGSGISKYDEMREVEKRIANGYRLFGKYYQNLWD